jgi:acyl-CoA synthetase (NDP forming)/RimJ/RimL family protein N-acetyltransferase
VTVAEPGGPEADAPPPHWRADVVLSDGRTVLLRPITPSDAGGLLALHSRMSERALYLRFFGPYPKIPPSDLKRFTTVDHRNRVALVAVLGDDLIAVARYERISDDSAEVAFIVQDDHQGRGLGSIMLEHLAAAACERGIRRFVAEVLAENTQMVRVFREAGYQVSRELDAGVLHLEFDIDQTPRSVGVAMAREQAAEARSVHNLLHPRSVAVIGASSDPSKIGHAVLKNLLDGDFAGPVYAINPQPKPVLGVPAYADISQVPGPVDLAVIAVPAASVAEVTDACLAKGVKALVVVSAGFGDRDSAGHSAERRLVEEARAHGMRVVGPSALGVVNTDPSVRLNASLAPVLPGRGRVGFFSQSGALGIAILAEAAGRGLGLSTFVSAGNRADLSGNDLLQYWQTDPATDVVLLYLESFGNPRKFARLARRLARTKPIVAVSSGRHPYVEPAQAAGSNTTMDDASVQAMFEQSGTIRVESLDQLFDTALLLANQPLPAGQRVAVVGNSTAIGLLAADAVLANRLSLVDAPVDVGVTAGPDEFAAAVAGALADDRVDALVAVFVPPIALDGAEHAKALRLAARDSGKPVVSTFLGLTGIPAELAAPDVGSPDVGTQRANFPPAGSSGEGALGADSPPGFGSVPSYPSPERAVRALARVVRYAQWRHRPVGEFMTPPGVEPDRVRELVNDWLAAGGPRRLSDDEGVELVAAAGIELVPFRRVSDADDCAEAAAELGYPVAVKAAGERWTLLGDLAGVRLNLHTEQGVRAAFADLAPLSATGQVYVQRMAPAGVSCAFGLDDDPSFGTVMSFGLHGALPELLGDRVYRALPLSDLDAAELVRAPRATPLLTGYRGAEPADLDALAELALRLSRLAELAPQLRRLTLHPVLATPQGAFVTAVQATIGPPPSRPRSWPRRLF